MSSAPRLLPSSLNWTPSTATLSDASAVTVTGPETVAPAAGAVIDTVGGVVSAVTTALASFDAGAEVAGGVLGLHDVVVRPCGHAVSV